uniref:MAGE domain-containing protein n=2 Tax=Molossus molossus TaxID=27622 RepID=A0A7J8J6M5_MOLMO|nr:hypothetical protein HJG59_009695 [Molossus molossus]
MELAFGLDLKEVYPSHHCYILISKMDLPSEESPSDDSMYFPKNGILMPLLDVIFFKGNRATEEETWDFLNTMGLYAGRSHFIFGKPRKFITTDLVKEKFLEYCQVSNSDPPCCEFLWGPKAHAETSKMKVLEFGAKINNTVPSAFPTQFEETLRDEEE